MALRQIATLISIVILTSITLAASQHALDVRVTPSGFTHAPATIHVEARVEPDPDNVGIGIVADCENFYASAVFEREQLRVINTRDFVDVPPGDCAVGVVLYRSHDHGDPYEYTRVVKDVHVVF